MHHYPIRSYVRRERHLTRAQADALEQWLPCYALPTQGLVDLRQLFGNPHPVVMEIGFGNGQLLVQQARQHPDINFIGLDVYRPGIGNLLQQLKLHDIHNVRIAQQDALEFTFPENTLMALWLFYPDPWPKKKHHKRRIVNPHFLSCAHRWLKASGLLHIASDWHDYVMHIRQLIQVNPLFVELDQPNHQHYPFNRPQTRFERRAIDKGLITTDLYFRPQPF